MSSSATIIQLEKDRPRVPAIIEVGDSHGEPGSRGLRYSPKLATMTLELPARPSEYLCVNWLERDPAPAPYQNGAKLPLADGPVRLANVAANKILSRPGAVKAYRQIDLDLGEARLDCLPGDTIGVLCNNLQAEVEELCNLLGLTDRLDNALEIRVMADTKKVRAKVPEFLPPEVGLRYLLSSCLDIRSVPKKLMLRALVDYTEDLRERRRLEELCSKQVPVTNKF
jgi:methionine synthase reductase